LSLNKKAKRETELGQWKQEALKEYSVLEAEYVNGKKAGAAHIDSNGLEKKVEKLRDIMVRSFWRCSWMRLLKGLRCGLSSLLFS
jgi:hypothetical protein